MLGVPAFAALMFLLLGAVRKASQDGILQTPGLVGEIREAQFTAPFALSVRSRDSKKGVCAAMLNVPH